MTQQVSRVPTTSGGGARVGYTRVSTVAQTLEQQNAALAAAGVTKTFSDTISGAADDRPGLSALLDYVPQNADLPSDARKPSTGEYQCAFLCHRHPVCQDWVSADIDYITICPDLPPGEVVIGGGPPNSERRGQLAPRFTGGGKPPQLLLPIGTELRRLGGRQVRARRD
jgi:hypothetical protein